MSGKAIKKASVQALGHGENHSQLDVPEPIRAYLETTLGKIDAVAGDVNSLWAVGERGLQMETAGKILAGRAFIELRNSLAPGEISSELAKRLISRSSFYYAIEVYELFSALPDLRVVQALAQMGVTKAMVIKEWPQEERLALASGQKVRGITLDAAVEMPTRQFAEAVRDPELIKADKKIRGLEVDNEGLKVEIKELKGALKHRYETLKMPDFAAHARQESVALAEQISLSVTSLEDLLTDRLVEDKEAKLFPEWQHRAANTMYHAVRSAHARTQALLQRMEKHFGAAITGKVEFDHTFSPGELLLAKDALAVITKRHQVEAENRAAERENAKGGRGRPRKIKKAA